MSKMFSSIMPHIGADNIIRGAPRKYEVQKSLGEFVLDKLTGRPGSLVMLVDSATGKSVTGRELIEDIVTVADKLRGLGLGVGSTVGYCSENRLEYPVPVVAALLVGATCAPVNPFYTREELKHTMGISKPSIVFCSPFTAIKLLEVKSDLPFLKSIIVFGEVETDDSFIAYNDLLKNKVDPSNFVPSKVNIYSDVSAVLCSSGTTGLPKCVELTHSNVNMYLESQLDSRIAGKLDNETLLGLIPFFHGYGFSLMLKSLIMNFKVIVMSMFDEVQFLKSIQDYKVSILMSVPPLLVFLSKNPLVDKYNLSSIRRIRCGAAPLSAEVQMAVQKRLKVYDIKQAYGMTELSVACVFFPADKNKMGSAGIVTPGMDMKVVDVDTGKALPPFKEGELCFKGPFVMKGYKNNPKATEETIDKDGWLHTGDIGYYDHEGFTFIVDRLKELIKYKGFQVAPAELEALLLTHPSVKDAAVIGIPDEEAGELPFSFIVKQDNAKVTAQELQAFVAGKVSAQKRLSGGVRFIEAIPKNPSGKILRRELRTLYKANPKL